MFPGFVAKNHPNAQKGRERFHAWREAFFPDLEEATAFSMWRQITAGAKRIREEAGLKRGVDDNIDDRETPPCVYVPLNAEYAFTLDAASSHENRKVASLYCTLGGLHANIAGRVVPVYEEDEMGGQLPIVDWSSAPEGIWRVRASQEAREEALASASAHLRLGRRRYTARLDGVSPVRQPELREPEPPFPRDGIGQYEGLRDKGPGARLSLPSGRAEGETEERDTSSEIGRESETGSRRTGLQISWADHRVYVNPPFSRIRPWVEKAWDETGATVALLLPNNRSEQPFFQELIEPYRDRPGSILTTRNLRKRRPFLSAGQEIGNRTSKSPPFGLTLVLWDRRRPTLGAR